MKKITSLKLAAFILFWFGIIAELFILVGSASEYERLGTFQGSTLEFLFYDMAAGSIFFAYTLFGHGIHIVAGYLLAKGAKLGIILAILISVYEIAAFFIPEINPVIFSGTGIGLRILFVIVILLIVFGKKELVNLQATNWRPWKNPLQDYTG